MVVQNTHDEAVADDSKKEIANTVARNMAGYRGGARPYSKRACQLGGSGVGYNGEDRYGIANVCDRSYIHVFVNCILH